MYQVSTLQALALGYSRSVIKVRELLQHGNTGLGTFENVDGEMVVMNGHCYRADQDGSLSEVPDNTGVPFAAVSTLMGTNRFPLKGMANIEKLREALTLKIEEKFSLNSMHVVRVDGFFSKVDARSEAPYRAHHLPLKDILAKNQRAFVFENIRGALIGVYFPDYMDGINMPGWHLHFISEDKTKGGHVFDMVMQEGEVRLDRINTITLELPSEPAFDTYSLKQQDLAEEIKSVE